MNKKLLTGVAVFVLMIIVLLSFGQNVQAETKKIALVLSGDLGDRSFLDSAYRGLKWSEERLDVETRYVEPANPSEFEPSIRAMARAGHDLIITLSFTMLDATNNVAQDYPDTQFAIVDAVSQEQNVTSLMFKEHVGSYLVGVLAGKMTETDKLGFVGGMEIPLIKRFQIGFEEGIKAVNPDAEINVGYVGAWDNPGNGKEIAKSQYQNGADIVYHAAGKTGEGVIAAAKEEDKYEIGVDSDQCYIAYDNMIASMMKMVDIAVFEAIQDVTEGQLEPGTKVFGLQQNAVGPCRLYSDILDLDNHKDFTGLDEAMKAVEEYKEKILNGEITVTDPMEMDTE